MRGLTSCVVVVGLLVGGGACRSSLDEDDVADGNNDTSDTLPIDAAPSLACQEATTYQNLAMIETKIFKASCTFSGCHDGRATDAGRLDLREGMSHADLVGVDSTVSSPRKMVVAGDPAASYLLLIMGHVAPGDASPPGEPPPSDIGSMPQGTGGLLLCEEKRDAVERWIMAGALND